MPLNQENKYYDFEELFFEKNCNIDDIIINFFSKYRNIIKGDTEYIIYKIKKIINDDRKILMELNGDGKDLWNRVGKISYIKHNVSPDQNNDKEYYIYCIHSFI
jgi:hypothetical protein